jgi:DNA-binding CsgD family transcriptional regulator
LQEQAARLSPRNDATARQRRRIQAAEHFFHAGDRAHARALLEAVLADGPAGPERSAALHLLGQIRAAEDSVADAIRYLEEALAHAGRVAASAPIKLDLAFAKNNAGDAAGAAVCAREALVEAEQLGDCGLIACALSVVVVAEFVLGRGVDRPSLRRALALEDRDRGGQLLLRPTSIAGIVAVYEGKIAEGEALLREMCAWATERGEESGLPFLLIHLSWLEWWRGDFAAAAAYAEDALSLSIQSGSDTMRALALQHRSRARAARGDVAGARADLSEGRALIDQTGYVQSLPWLLSSQATLELSLGDAEAAARTLAPLVSMVEAIGIAEPLAGYFVPDAVEALIGVGQPTRAQALLSMFARRAQELARPWAIASAARGQSLLAAAQGDLDTALAAAEDAVARWEQLEMPIEVGRALVSLGQVRRRRGERRGAREALERAVVLLRSIGASLWAECAAEELRRIPIRRAAAKDELTPTEEQVARLAAAGRTNREVAGALHMSPKTVEANLGRIYDKLRIHSRAELGARMLERQNRPSQAQK